jgi:hypothetical protein
MTTWPKCTLFQNNFRASDSTYIYCHMFYGSWLSMSYRVRVIEIFFIGTKFNFKRVRFNFTSILSSVLVAHFFVVQFNF